MPWTLGQLSIALLTYGLENVQDCSLMRHKFDWFTQGCFSITNHVKGGLCVAKFETKFVYKVPFFFQIEDCLNKVMAFQRQHSSENISRPLIRSSLLQDAVSEDGKIVVKVVINESLDDSRRHSMKGWVGSIFVKFVDSLLVSKEAFLLVKRGKLWYLWKSP